MENAMAIAYVAAPMYLIMGLSVMLYAKQWQKIMNNWSKDHLQIFPLMFLYPILGMIVIGMHNVWEWNWRVVVTIVGYLSLLKGIMNLFYPEWARYFAEMYRDKTAYTITGGVTIFLGLYLLYSTML